MIKYARGPYSLASISRGVQICWDTGRSQTVMKIKIDNMFTWYENHKIFYLLPLPGNFLFRWLLLACVVPMSRLQPRPVWNLFVFIPIWIRPVSQLIWTPVDLDPRSISTSRYGPPGPNLLADMDPRGSKSTSKYWPPLADLDPPSKVKYM
jgi:hypothetical protein